MAFTENPLFSPTNTESGDVLGPLPGASRFITVIETNYNLEKRMPVEGIMSIGQLTFGVVEEIGKRRLFHIRKTIKEYFYRNTLIHYVAKSLLRLDSVIQAPSSLICFVFGASCGHQCGLVTSAA